MPCEVHTRLTRDLLVIHIFLGWQMSGKWLQIKAPESQGVQKAFEHPQQLVETLASTVSEAWKASHNKLEVPTA